VRKPAHLAFDSSQPPEYRSLGFLPHEAYIPP
jgi:hypothetical protein